MLISANYSVDNSKTVVTKSEAIAAAVAAESVRLEEAAPARDAAEQVTPAVPVKKAGKKMANKTQENPPGGVVVGLAEEPPRCRTQPLGVGFNRY